MLIHNAVITGSLTLPTALPITGSLLLSGSVGINTTVPSSLFHVYKNDITNVNMVSQNAFINQGNLLQFVQNTAGVTNNAYIGHGGDNSGNFVIFNGGIQRVAITSGSGFVGIGSSTPAKQLVVNQTGTTGYFLSGEASGTEIAYWYYSSTEIQFSSKSATRALSLMTNDTTRLQISAAGTSSFGGTAINTAADAATITIKQPSTTYTNGIYLERSGERNGYYMYVGGAVDSLTFRRNYFGTQSDVMSLTRDGAVGIGTASPGSYAASGLVVYGNTSSNFGMSIDNAYTSTSSGTTSLFLYNAGTLKVRFDYARDVDSGILGTTANIPMLFYTNGSERVRVTSSGNVKLNAKTITSHTSNPGNVGNGGTTTLTINQASGEYQSTYLVSIVGLYAPAGSNQNGFYTGLVTFFTDSAIAQANITALHNNGWSASASATTGGSFTVTFTNGSGATMTNIAIRALKINVTGAD